MNAQDVPVTQFIDGARQFIVPVFQRDYSWGTRHCKQLWDDILRVGADSQSKAHFLGSVVYMAAEDINADVPRWLVIDGQQRLTTLSLLLVALRERLKKQNEPTDGLPTSEAVEDRFLCNRHAKGDRRQKLALRRADHDTLEALVEGRELPQNSSERLVGNHQFFVERLADTDIAVVWRGLAKLVIVHVSLTRGQDDPQLIFESLNSTGVDLTQADLIRNFVLMRLDEAEQTRLYEEYWQPIEAAFGARYRTDFDKFMRDYLTLQLKPSKQLRADQIYHHFRTWFFREAASRSVSDMLAELKRFGRYFSAFSLGHEQSPKLKEAFSCLRQLVEVATPVVLRLYDCADRAGTLSEADFADAVGLLESYVFRRSVCDMQTRSLGQIFATLAYRIKDAQPLLSLKVALARQGKNRRFPGDAEFREALSTRNVYDMRHCSYLLDRLENDSKEKIDTSNFSIEHILPQKEDLRPQWRQMLGEDWKTIQEVWLHRLGNITLTGYNSEYGDRSFEEKKIIQNGFNDSPLRLNKFVKEQSVWTAKEIEARGKQLASKALGVWKPLSIDPRLLQQAELEELKAQAAGYSAETLVMEEDVRSLFEAFRPHVMALGDDVLELFGTKTATYRVYEFFLEVIPRKDRLTLLLNLDFEDCEDPSDNVWDNTENEFVVYATQDAGVGYSLRQADNIDDAMRLVRLAYAKVTE